MDKAQLKEIGKALAKVVHMTVAWEEALDGDATEDLSKEFLKELDLLMGNA